MIYKYANIVKTTEIKIARLRKGITQSNIGKKMKLSRQAYSFLEHGGRLPNIVEAYNLSKILGGKIEDYFNLEGEK